MSKLRDEQLEEAIGIIASLITHGVIPWNQPEQSIDFRFLPTPSAKSK